MSIAELNEAIGERVDEINHQIVRADHTTRFERFTAEQAEALAPYLWRASRRWNGNRSKSGGTTMSPAILITTQCPTGWPGNCCGRD